jgi:hypothetical protein
MTAVALGVEGGTTSTFWRDANGDGQRDADERDLCNVVATSADVATCTFTIGNPPFAPGLFASGGSCTVGAMVGCNFINVVDGENPQRTTNFPTDDNDGSQTDKDLTQAVVDRQKFELEPTIDVQPRSANTGDKVTVSVFDFDPADPLEQIILAGIDVTPDSFPLTIPSSGQTSFTFTIPGVGPTGCVGTACNRIPTGVQRIEIFSDSGDQDLNITIGGAKLTTSHKEVIANQDLTITGSGFTEGGDVCIPESGPSGTIGGITLNNITLAIDDDDDCDITDVNGIELTSGGTFTLTVIVGQLNGDSHTALLTPGSVELKVIDTSGSEGTILVTIPPRSIDVTPKSSRPRDAITVSGKNFIADNPDGADATITVTYDCGSDDRTTTAEPDASGNWTETMNIPSDCAIPSTNTITAEITGDEVDDGVITTVTHEIPEATVKVEPLSGKPGDRITITGDGFRTFDTVEKIEIGGRGTLGGRTVTTDAQGAFTISDLIVPGLDPGIHAVIVEVGTDTDRTTASGLYEVASDVVTPGGPAPTAPIPVATALVTPLGVEFVRAFNFNNQSKVWTFYDARPEFKDINTLKDVTGGQVYWVNVLNDKTITFCNRSITLYKGWNQVPC